VDFSACDGGALHGFDSESDVVDSGGGDGGDEDVVLEFEGVSLFEDIGVGDVFSVESDSSEFDVHNDFLEFEVLRHSSDHGHGVFLTFNGVGSHGNSGDLDLAITLLAVGKGNGGVLELKKVNEGVFSPDIDGYDLSETESGGLVVDVQVGLDFGDVLLDEIHIFKQVEESLFSFSGVGEGILDGVHPVLFFLVTDLAVGSRAIELFVRFNEGGKALNNFGGALAFDGSHQVVNLRNKLLHVSCAFHGIGNCFLHSHSAHKTGKEHLRSKSASNAQQNYQ